MPQIALDFATTRNPSSANHSITLATINSADYQRQEKASHKFGWLKIQNLSFMVRERIWNSETTLFKQKAWLSETKITDRSNK
jgi:hypothetical protein